MNVVHIKSERLSEFIAVARRVHANDPAWIPPLTQPQLSELAEQEAHTSKIRQALFLCDVGGESVGRIGAFMNPRLLGADGRLVGQVGYFECVEDNAVSLTLIEAACRWLSAQGASEVWGPMAGGAHRLHRFMTAGFQRSPFLLEPRNPPYYPAMFERCGFRQLHAWDSYDIPAAQLCTGLLEDMHVERKAARARRRFRLSFPSSTDAVVTLARLHRLLDAIWGGHVGYASLDPGEFAAAFGGMLAILPVGYLGVLEYLQGGDAGLALMYPDDIVAFAKLNGDASGWGRWRADMLPDRVVLHTTAVVPEARGGGGVFLFLEDAVRKIRRDGYRDAVIALVDRTAGLPFAFAPRTRSYALYRRSITAARP